MTKIHIQDRDALILVNHYFDGMVSLNQLMADVTIIEAEGYAWEAVCEKFSGVKLVNGELKLDVETADEPDQFLHDGEADGDALASAGFGTDEDYGCYGGCDE